MIYLFNKFIKVSEIITQEGTLNLGKDTAVRSERRPHSLSGKVPKIAKNTPPPQKGQKRVKKGGPKNPIFGPTP